MLAASEGLNCLSDEKFLQAERRTLQIFSRCIHADYLAGTFHMLYGVWHSSWQTSDIVCFVFWPGFLYLRFSGPEGNPDIGIVISACMPPFVLFLN